jgi:hypothetical protein
MKLKADRSGFLISEPIRPQQAERMLAGVKGDTGKILALLQRGQAARSRGGTGSAAGTATPAPRGATRAASRLPADAASSTGNRARAGSAAQTARAHSVEAQATVAAEAAASVARSVEQQRRDAKADVASERARAQARDASGRFGSGGGGRGLLSRLGRLTGVGGISGDGAAQIDPLLGAVSEAASVVAPVGRAGSAIAGGAVRATGPESWLRRMWRELRLFRREESRASRAQLDELKEGNRGGGGLASGSGFFGMLSGLGGAIGGGIMSLGAKILPMVLGVLSKAFMTVVAPVAAAIGSWKLGQLIGGKVYEWLDNSGLLTKVFDGIDAVREAVGALWAGAKGKWENVKQVAGNVATAASSFVRSNLGRAAGWVSSFFESGKGGAGTISTGKGDFGGKSYGTHQLSSKTGTLQRFLNESGYASQFAGMNVGSAAFDAQWKRLASDEAFGAAQHDFMRRTHVDPMMRRLKYSGIDLSGRGESVKEAIFSTATQFGPGSSLVRRALVGRDVAGMSDADIVSAIQDYKIANNETLFRSSDAATRASTLNRAFNEKQALLSVAAGGAQVPRAAAVGGVPAVARVQAAGPVPRVDPVAAPRSGGASLAGAGPGSPPAGQDVRDRTIAHIVTGGIGGVLAHR